MKDINIPPIEALAKDVAQAIGGARRFALRALHRISWQGLMLACVALSLLIAVMPLALLLFIIFLLLKLLVGIVWYRSRKAPPAPNRAGP
ncbi:membrane protein implicated in regulation of membrane protease activity [Oxalobacteraceae bacterium GrIS 1.11]